MPRKATSERRPRLTRGQKAFDEAVKKSSLSNAEVAAKLESTQAAVWNWRAGYRIPSGTFIARIEKHFSVKAYLWGESI